MRTLLTSLVTAVGVAALAGGICSLVFGFWHNGSLTVNWAGPLSGVWGPPEYCFFGGVLVAAGSGLATFGLLLRRPID
jgi:uncharacterized membrane protein HdeD (DUF308 family)